MKHPWAAPEKLSRAVILTGMKTHKENFHSVQPGARGSQAPYCKTCGLAPLGEVLRWEGRMVPCSSARLQEGLGEKPATCNRAMGTGDSGVSATGWQGREWLREKSPSVVGTEALSQKEITEVPLICQARGWALPSWEREVNTGGGSTWRRLTWGPGGIILHQGWRNRPNCRAWATQVISMCHWCLRFRLRAEQIARSGTFVTWRISGWCASHVHGSLTSKQTEGKGGRSFARIKVWWFLWKYFQEESYSMLAVTSIPPHSSVLSKIQICDSPLPCLPPWCHPWRGNR